MTPRSPAMRMEQSTAADRAPFDAASVAAGLFRARQSYASQMLGQGRLTRDKAEAKLRPWLAIAAAAGADLPELELHGNELYPDAGKPIVLRLRADEICPATEWRPALAAARNAAIAACEGGEPAKITQARDLITLANTLGIERWMP